jgi:hypothetical protein
MDHGQLVGWGLEKVLGVVGSDELAPVGWTDQRTWAQAGQGLAVRAGTAVIAGNASVPRWRVASNQALARAQRLLAGSDSVAANAQRPESSLAEKSASRSKASFCRHSRARSRDSAPGSSRGPRDGPFSGARERLGLVGAVLPKDTQLNSRFSPENWALRRLRRCFRARHQTPLRRPPTPITCLRRPSGDTQPTSGDPVATKFRWPSLLAHAAGPRFDLARIFWSALERPTSTLSKRSNVPRSLGLRGPSGHVVDERPACVPGCLLHGVTKAAELQSPPTCSHGRVNTAATYTRASLGTSLDRESGRRQAP